MRARGRALLAAALVVESACFPTIPDVRNEQVGGTWNLSIRNGPNGCHVGDPWTEGDMNAVTLTVTQDQRDDAKITANIEGLAALIFAFGFGTTAFNGTIDGRDLDIVLRATGKMMRGACTFTLELRATARVEGRGTVLSGGRLVYSPFTTTGDCAAVAGCQTVQTFEGVRVAGPAPAPDAAAQ